MNISWKARLYNVRARVGRRVRGKTASAAVEVLSAERKPFVPDGHYYSPVVNIEDVEREQDRIWPAAPKPLGIDFNHAGHERFLDGEFANFVKDYDYPNTDSGTSASPRFHEENPMFGKLDSRALFCMLRTLRPRKMVEIGCGFSSLLTADVNCRFLNGALDFTCVEPYPPPFLREGLSGITRLLARRAQDVPELHRELGPGDVLFIDSSHVSKTGSDVNYLYFEVLPRLVPGVIVHIHDIFLPHDYPQYWVFGGRSWNEQYLVQALLTFTHSFHVVFSSSYAHSALRSNVARALGGEPLAGSSLWLAKIGPAASD